MSRRALVVGSSDGIGLALVRDLLDRGWSVRGLSRSASPLAGPAYEHVTVDVREPRFPGQVAEALDGEPTSLVVYCAGIGEPFDAVQLDVDVATFEVNLMGLVRTVERALPVLLEQGAGTIVGLSSMADVIRSGEAPAYGAAKAGMSHYLEALRTAVQGRGVHVVNTRLGFVDTKMAKSPIKPWMLTPEQAAARILRGALSAAPPRRLNIPRRMAVLASLVGLLTR